MTEPTTSAAAATTGGAPALPPAPRDLTPRASRAAWAQPHVRFWWLLALALALVALYFLITQAAAWQREAWLVREGTVVDATVWEAGQTVKGRQVPALGQVDVKYEYDGKSYNRRGDLAEREGCLKAGDTIKIRIDPQSPEVWTNRTSPPSLGEKMVAPLLLLPAVLVAAVGMLVARRRVTGVWRGGELRQAVVVDTRQTPLAPLSQAVRCALVDAKDKRLITVYVPNRYGKLGKGQAIWLVSHPADAQRSIPAAVFA